jgi:hypothetical protein
MFDSDSDDILDDDDELLNSFPDIECEDIYLQWRTERWLMRILLWPAKAPRQHQINKLVWMARSPADLAVVLDALEQDGLIERNGGSVSATRAAISFWRLELTQAGPPR